MYKSIRQNDPVDQLFTGDHGDQGLEPLENFGFEFVVVGIYSFINSQTPLQHVDSGPVAVRHCEMKWGLSPALLTARKASGFIFHAFSTRSLSYDPRKMVLPCASTAWTKAGSSSSAMVDS